MIIEKGNISKKLALARRKWPTSFSSYVTKTFPEHPNKRCSVMTSRWHVWIFSEQNMVSFLHTAETTQER